MLIRRVCRHEHNLLYPAILAKHLAHEVYPDTSVIANTRHNSLNIYPSGQSSRPETFRALAI